MDVMKLIIQPGRQGKLCWDSEKTTNGVKGTTTKMRVATTVKIMSETSPYIQEKFTLVTNLLSVIYNVQICI